MSNFWGQALGVPAQQPAGAPVARPAVGGYSPSPFFTPSQPQNAPSEAAEQPEGPEVPGQWGTVEGSRQKALSAKLTDLCPECGSDKIFRPHGMPNAMPQCYECGYNPRFAQMTGGGGLPSDATGPAQPARQLETGGRGGKSNFDPGHIVGRV